MPRAIAGPPKGNYVMRREELPPAIPSVPNYGGYWRP